MKLCDGRLKQTQCLRFFLVLRPLQTCIIFKEMIILFSLLIGFYVKYVNQHQAMFKQTNKKENAILFLKYQPLLLRPRRRIHVFPY